VKQVFPGKQYVSLENPDERSLAITDPRAFLNRMPKGGILDEIQRAPELLSYLQEILDETDQDGLFILTGSNNLLLQEGIGQTLAGRIGVLDLFPFSLKELPASNRPKTLNDSIWTGSYPEVHEKNRKPALWYPSYLRTYVERDVRQIQNIADTMLFQKFLRLCAGRIGQLLNVSALSNECGIAHKTAEAWLSLLEKTYVIKLLPPYHRNFNKRITKSPKLYFIDTGLACTLLQIKSTKELSLSHFRGALVENYIIMDIMKDAYHQGNQPSIFYWRENNGVEVDLVIESLSGQKFTPIEIKSAQTYTPDHSKSLKKFMKYSGTDSGIVLYDGNMEFESSDQVQVMNWRKFLLK
jgi:hypothetical protein